MVVANLESRPLAPAVMIPKYARDWDGKVFFCQPPRVKRDYQRYPKTVDERAEEHAWKALLAVAARKPDGVLSHDEYRNIIQKAHERESRQHATTLVWMGVKRGNGRSEAMVDSIAHVPAEELYSDGIAFVLDAAVRLRDR